jgi:hypothetical protein
MPIIISARARQKGCSVSRAGIGAPQPVVEQAGWKQGQHKVEIGFIPDVKCILLSGPSESEEGFLVAYANSRSKTGARIACQAFARVYLQAITVLPKRNLTAIVLREEKWRLALFLENIPWQTEEFTKKGAESVDNDILGVYQLLGRQGVVLRVGEGKIRERLASHLSDHMRFMPVVKSFRYARLNMKEDAELLEKILIANYEGETGVLPPLNEIRA